jgi:methylated-DNA-[protein]-cysteine S-methyltransferase
MHTLSKQIAKSPSISLDVFLSGENMVEHTALSMSPDGHFHVHLHSYLKDPKEANIIIHWMEGYAKSNISLPSLPLAWSNASPFQRKIYMLMSQIKHGQSMSYGELAKKAGTPNAARAVGTACGKNPFPLIIPCHRILAANGKIGGFSCGLQIKKELLAFEGIGIIHH